MPNGKYYKWLEPENLMKIKAWARDGLIDVQIAHNMGISETTLYSWKSRFEAIDDALKEGKEVVDIQVENALLKRALGYRYDEITIEGGVETKRVTKEVVPDTTAQIFWLKNRKPAEWRDRQDLNINDPNRVQTEKSINNIESLVKQMVPIQEDDVDE